MTPGFKTTEFYLSAIVAVLGLAGTLGFLTPDQADVFTKSITEIFGAVAAIYTTVRYIRSRTEIKIAGIRQETELRIAGIQK